MPYPYYPHSGGPAAEPVNDLPEPWDSRKATPAERAQDLALYDPDPGLVDAVNAALVLGRPLLLTGDAGTGKTKLAYHLAWQLGLGEPLRFETQSASHARDLFYLYDAVGHFRAAQRGDAEILGYFSLAPLGLAILLALEADELTARPLLRKMLDSALAQHQLPPYAGPRRSVVLIDEIDKAPRDFPNDLLNQIDEMYFRIPELARELSAAPIRAQTRWRPVTVITSNSEKHLPEPFLRRCVYYNIPFPDDTRMKKIISLYAKDLSDALLNDALALFYILRDQLRGKKPSTAELLGWLHLLRTTFARQLADAGFQRQKRPLAAHHEIVRQTLSALVKVRSDQEEQLEELIRQWRDKP